MDIILENISKSYQNQLILNSISYTFLEKKTYCIMGASGCGKTTLFRLMLGLDIPDCGIVSGIDISSCRVVFQEDRLCETFSAVENVAMISNNQKAKQLARQELLLLLPTDSLDKPVSKLSGGMRRRVSICRALFAPSSIIFMDEPFTGLDTITKKLIIEYIKGKVSQKTVFVTTHQIEDIRLLNAEVFDLSSFN